MMVEFTSGRIYVRCCHVTFSCCYIFYKNCVGWGVTKGLLLCSRLSRN